MEEAVLLRWSRPQQVLAPFMMMVCCQYPITEGRVSLTFPNIPGKRQHFTAAGKQEYRHVFINVVQIFLFYLPRHVT
jgi:hypothetical protein